MEPTPCPPWRWQVAGTTLLVTLREPFLALGWAPLGGGYRLTAVIANHQIALDNHAALATPTAYLARVLDGLGHRSPRAVAMMTGASVSKVGVALTHHDGLVVGAWCTAGCSNALRVGDPATAPTRPGTINLIVTVSCPLARPALAEALQIATEARVIAVQEAGIVSRKSQRPATGTGTDCIVVAAPAARARGSVRYSGKHTVAGELIGRAVLKSCHLALKRAVP